MKKSEQLVMGALGVILVLAGFAGFNALRAHRLQERVALLEDANQSLQARYEALRMTRTHPAASEGADVLMAPEVTTVSGRDAQLKAPGIQANSIPVFLAEPMPPAKR